MSQGRVLVAFASQTGITAGIAETIANALADEGFEVDCRAVASVDDVAPYEAVILGSGVFSTRRLSDGGGFLARHAGALRDRPLWLYTAGPIGGVHARTENGVCCHVDEPPAVVLVARAVSARGSASFGSARLELAGDEPADGQWADEERIREWARGIAADLRRNAATRGLVA